MINRFHKISGSALIAVLLLPSLVLAGLGEGSSGSGAIDTVDPALEITYPTDRILVDGGTVIDFTWTADDTNPGSIRAVLTFDGAPADSMDFDFTGTTFQWTWTSTTTPIADCRLIVTVVDTFGNTSTQTSAWVTIYDPATGVQDEVPTRTALLPAWPNPFNPQTNIRFELAKSAQVDLGVYDLMGRRVAALGSGRRDAGRHTLVWTGTDRNDQRLAAGIYLVRMSVLEKAGWSHQVQKVVLLP